MAWNAGGTAGDQWPDDSTPRNGYKAIFPTRYTLRATLGILADRDPRFWRIACNCSRPGAAAARLVYTGYCRRHGLGSGNVAASGRDRRHAAGTRVGVPGCVAAALLAQP